MEEAKTFWLLSLLKTVGVVMVAYFVAIFVYLVLVRLSQIPKGPFIDDTLHGALLFIGVMIVVAACLVPIFQKEWDSILRSFSMFLAVFLVGYAVFNGSGIIDPNIPLNLLLHYGIDPLKARLGL